MPIINLVLRDIAGQVVNGTLRVELDIVAANAANVFVPSVQTLAVVDGDVSVTVPSGINATYWFGETDSIILYKLGQLSPTTNGDFGTKVRVANGQTTGTQDYSTVAGGMLAATSPPINDVTIAIVNAAIGKDGTVFVPVESIIAIDETTSFYSLSLPYTAQLYDNNGKTPALRLIQSRVKIGIEDFTVPSVASSTFSVSAGSVVIIEA